MLEDVVYRGRQSIIFSVENHEDMLLKYQADCDEVKKNILNPLIREYWYSNDANELGISPRVFFLSPSIAFDYRAKLIENFKMDYREKKLCASSGGSVRFALIQRLGSAIDLYTLQDRFPHGKVPFPMVMRIGIELLDKLRELHSRARVVHGDIHPGNVMIGEDLRVWLIDFGRSRSNLPARSKEPVDGKFSWLSLMLSPWQIEGYVWSARDDVYNAIRTLALLINGDDYLTFERRIKNAGPRQILNWKKYGNIWFLPGDYQDTLRSLPVSLYRKEAIRQSLDRVLGFVRNLKDVDDVPEYEKIVREFEFCRIFADARESQSSFV